MLSSCSNCAKKSPTFASSSSFSFSIPLVEAARNAASFLSLESLFVKRCIFAVTNSVQFPNADSPMLVTDSGIGSGASSSTRGLQFGGYANPGANHNVIQYIVV